MGHNGVANPRFLPFGNVACFTTTRRHAYLQILDWFDLS